MDLVLDLLATVSRWSRSNLSEISLALVGCLLVLFGADIKGWVEQRLGSIAGALRVPLMALLCLIGSGVALIYACLLYTSPSPRDGLLSRMPSSA